MEYTINKFNKNHKSWQLEIYNGWKINFPFQIINDLMLELINKINEIYLIKILEFQNDIKTLVFTGGASSNNILFDMIKDLESLKNIKVVNSPNPEVAIAYGSLYYSYDHYAISPRKSKYTFGIKSSDIWNEKKHKKGGKKIYDNYDNVFRCKNAFTKFITIYENLRPDKEISHFFGLHESKAKVELYKTKKENVIFTDEKDKDGDLIIHKFGEFLIDVGNKYDRSNKELEIKMKMGGTFISATAKYRKTGDTFKITCLYED